MMRLVFGILWFSSFALCGTHVSAGELLNVAGKFDPQPQTRRFAFEIGAGDSSLLLDASVKVQQGTAAIRVLAPDGSVVYQASCGGWMTLSGQPLKVTGRGGTCYVELANEAGTAEWTLRITSVADPAFAPDTLWSALSMFLVGSGVVVAWRWTSGAGWRWFWVGAGVWSVGVALKFACAIPLNGPLLGVLQASLPRWAYLLVGSLYVGLMTGVFEIGVTLAAALVWKRMTADAARGVAVGVGAGGFEAVLLGAAAAATAVAILLTPGAGTDLGVATAAAAARVTPWYWLVGPVERILTIACHASSRALVLWGVARGRWRWPFLGGFLIMTVIDSVGGYAHVSESLGRISLWWIELAIIPTVVVSLPILVWCVRHWPRAEPARGKQVS